MCNSFMGINIGKAKKRMVFLICLIYKGSGRNQIKRNEINFAPENENMEIVKVSIWEKKGFIFPRAKKFNSSTKAKSFNL